MSELLLIQFGVAPTDVSKSGAPSSEHEMVFVYESIFKSSDGSFTDGDLGTINPSNRNYVKRALGMVQQEESYERTITVNKSVNKPQVDSFLDEKLKELKKMNDEIAHMVLTLVMRLVWKKFTTYKTAGDLMSHIWLNDAFKMITNSIVNLRDVLNESLEIKYPSSVSTKLINNALQFRDLQIKQTLDSDINKMKKKPKKIKKK